MKEHKIRVKFSSGFSFQRNKSEWLYPMYLKFKVKKYHWVYHILSLLNESTKLSQCLLCEAARYPWQMMCLLLLMMVRWWITHWLSHAATSAVLLSQAVNGCLGLCVCPDLLGWISDIWFPFLQETNSPRTRDYALKSQKGNNSLYFQKQLKRWVLLGTSGSRTFRTGGATAKWQVRNVTT